MKEANALILETLEESTIQILREAYLSSLVNGDEERASLVITRALQQHIPIPTIYLEIICPAQQDLGVLWERGSISVTQEHIATQISLNQISVLREQANPKPDFGYSVLLCVPQGETHFFAARVVGDFFYFDGWRVYFPGTDTPVNDLLSFIKEKQVDVIGISISLSPSEDFSGFLKQLKALPNSPKIVIGGSAAQEAAQEKSVDGIAESPDDAVLIARSLMGKEGIEAGTTQFLKNIGAFISSTRKSKKMSQQDLARNANLDRAYISAIENGKQNVTIGALYRVAHALRMPVEKLLCHSNWQA